MSYVQIGVVRVVDIPSLGGSQILVEDSDFIAAPEIISSTSSSQVTTQTVTSQFSGDLPRNYAWRVAVIGSDGIYAKAGTTPIASYLGKGIPGNWIQYIRVASFGEKLAVINVA